MVIIFSYHFETSFGAHSTVPTVTVSPWSLLEKPCSTGVFVGLRDKLDCRAVVVTVVAPSEKSSSPFPVRFPGMREGAG